VVAINTTDERRPLPVSGAVVLGTRDEATTGGTVAPHAGAVLVS
jgi:hypothetical protein